MMVWCWVPGQARHDGAAQLSFRLMQFAIENEVLGASLCIGIAKNPRNKVARFVEADELARLGRALERHEARWPDAHVVAAAEKVGNPIAAAMKLDCAPPSPHVSVRLEEADCL